MVQPDFNLRRKVRAGTRAGLMAAALLLGGGADLADAPAPGWTAAQAAQLLRWARAAPQDALPAPDTRELDAALAAASPAASPGADTAAIDRAAGALALRLARMHLLGVATPAERGGWRIDDSDTRVDLGQQLARALAADGIDAFFAGLRPSHPDYAALRAALAAEPDAARRKTIARNMERWRWMPQSLGDAYVLVNTASFEASLWRQGRRVATWPVIVGKPATPSPVFSATITGVTFNPWWDIPASIVREKGGRFPARLGYVRAAGGWHQKPGPNNALGQMKLVMPNPFSVYLHDTPGRSLFARDVRAFSHGCIRVNDALGFAAALLDGARTRAQIDAIVASRQTATVNLPASLPVYITYFTAGMLGNGTFAIVPDIYRRDGRIALAVAQTPGGCRA